MSIQHDHCPRPYNFCAAFARGPVRLPKYTTYRYGMPNAGATLRLSVACTYIVRNCVYASVCIPRYLIYRTDNTGTGLGIRTDGFDWESMEW